MGECEDKVVTVEEMEVDSGSAEVCCFILVCCVMLNIIGYCTRI